MSCGAGCDCTGTGCAPHLHRIIHSRLHPYPPIGRECLPHDHVALWSHLQWCTAWRFLDGASWCYLSDAQSALCWSSPDLPRREDWRKVAQQLLGEA